MKASAKNAQKKKQKPSAKAPLTKNKAKSAGLAKVDALLGRAGAKAAGKAAVAAPEPVAAAPAKNARTASRPGATQSPAAAPKPVELTRFERSIARAEKGEPGPILIKDLNLDEDTVEVVRASGQVELYKRILKNNPQAQPGRPLVNIVGSSDKDLSFHLLSLYELVLAAMEVGRDAVQVSLVRLSPSEAEEMLARPVEIVQEEGKKELTPLEVAKTNGFYELELSTINRSENIRQEIDVESDNFNNLVESIRTIGLQNPPVVEVRELDDGTCELVCVSGHRRLLALESLGHDRVTCSLKVFQNEKHRALAGLAENVNRQDLHFLDKADGYGALARQGMSANEIAAILDSDARTVAKYIRASEWEPAIKRRIRDLGAKATTRFLLNTLAAGERTTTELDAMLDRFEGGASSGAGKKAKADTRTKLEEFYQLTGCSPDQRSIIERALKFLGVMG